MVYMTKSKYLFNVNLDEEQVKQLEELAAYRNQFKSTILRDALRAAYNDMMEEINENN